MVLPAMLPTSVQVSQMDLNPITRHYMAIMHTRTEGYSFIIKTIATIASVMVNDTKWLSILYFVCFITLTYLHNKWVRCQVLARVYLHTGIFCGWGACLSVHGRGGTAESARAKG